MESEVLSFMLVNCQIFKQRHYGCQARTLEKYCASYCRIAKSFIAPYIKLFTLSITETQETEEGVVISCKLNVTYICVYSVNR